MLGTGAAAETDTGRGQHARADSGRDFGAQDTGGSAGHRSGHFPQFGPGVYIL
jgi:hypothetical protein